MKQKTDTILEKNIRELFIQDMMWLNKHKMIK